MMFTSNEPFVLSDYEDFIQSCFKDVEHEYNKCPAHGLDHIHNVLRNTLKLMSYFTSPEGAQLDVHVAIAAAIYHDVGLEDRDTHHLIAKERILNKEFRALDVLTEEQLKLTATAVSQHRASYKGERSEHGILLSCADIGGLRTPEEIFNRSFKYSSERTETELEARIMAAEHLKDKFGVNGYISYPECYAEVWGVDLQHERAKVDAYADKVLAS